MSHRAVAYVQGRRLAAPDAARVFLLLAEHTKSSSLDDDETPMGLLLNDADIPGLAAGLGIDTDNFRDLLRRSPRCGRGERTGRRPSRCHGEQGEVVVEGLGEEGEEGEEGHRLLLMSGTMTSLAATSVPDMAFIGMSPSRLPPGCGQAATA